MSCLSRPLQFRQHSCSFSMPSSVQRSLQMDKTLVFKALAIRTLHVHSDASTLTETDVKFALDVCVPRYNRIIAKSPKAAARYGFIFYRNTTFLSTLRHPFRRALRCTHLMFIYSAFSWNFNDGCRSRIKRFSSKPCHWMLGHLVQFFLFILY